MEEIKGKAQVIDITGGKKHHAGLVRAKKVLLSGGIVAFPTESFYGLAVHAMKEEAIRRLFITKKRTNDRPILILIHDPVVLELLVEKIPRVAQKLMQHFWPGGLTLVFKAGPRVSPLLTAHSGKIGIRLSSNPIARALSLSIDAPITGTSANITGKPACVSAVEVGKSFGRGVDLILDGGSTAGGKGSTLVDITTEPPLILREGMIGEKDLRQFLHQE